MPKGKILQDSFEQIVELGQSTAKKGAKQAAQTFSPLNILENLTSSSASKPNEIDNKKSDHTPIDIGSLKENYDVQDKQKENALRNKLFQLVKSGDDQEMQKKKSEERQKTVDEQKEEEPHKVVPYSAETTLTLVSPMTLKIVCREVNKHAFRNPKIIGINLF